MAVATRAFAKRTRPSDRIRKKPDTDPPEEGDADYGMREHRFRFFSELALTDPDGWMQVFPLGKYTYSDIGEIEITAERCANFVRNFDDNARGHAIPVNREHVAELGAVGWFKELAQRDDGVWAKVEWNDDGQELIKKQAFKFVSPEFYDEYSDPKTGKVIKDLLVGCAITNYPRFYDMTPVAANERVAAAMKQAAESFEERIEAVRDALQSLYGWDIWVDDEGTFDDYVVVHWMDAYWSFPYTVAADGDVSLGIPTEVERTFTPATAASERKAKKSRLPKEETMATVPTTGPAPAAVPAPTTPPAAVTASEGVMISASELTTLREQAAQGATAMAEAKRANASLRLMAANEVIEASKRAGRITPAEEDFWRSDLIAASDERFEAVKKYLGDKPQVVTLGAVGTGAEAEIDESKRIDAAARKYMSEHKDASYREALISVTKEGK